MHWLLRIDGCIIDPNIYARIFPKPEASWTGIKIITSELKHKNKSKYSSSSCKAELPCTPGNYSNLVKHLIQTSLRWHNDIQGMSWNMSAVPYLCRFLVQLTMKWPWPRQIQIGLSSRNLILMEPETYCNFPLFIGYFINSMKITLTHIM